MARSPDTSQGREARGRSSPFPQHPCGVEAPQVLGCRFSLGSYVAPWTHADRRTQESNGLPALLRGAARRQASGLRGLAGLLPRGTPLARRRPSLWLRAGDLPGDVPSVSAPPRPTFFVAPPRGPQRRPKKAAARELIITLRKRNYSVYEISEALKERQIPLSPTAVREVLTAEGFAPLPRRLDDERPAQPRPTVEPVADARAFSLAPREFTTACGGLFLFVPELVRLPLLAQSSSFGPRRMTAMEEPKP